MLEEAGIDMVFGIAGGNMGRLYDALYDHQGTIRTVLVRHEQLASVMAEVYGRLTGNASPSGRASSPRQFLGTLEAHFGSSPMLLLTDSPTSRRTPSIRLIRAGPATTAAPTRAGRSTASREADLRRQ